MEASVDQSFGYVNVGYLVLLQVTVGSHAFVHTHTVEGDLVGLPQLTTQVIGVKHRHFCGPLEPLSTQFPNVGVGPNHHQEVAVKRSHPADGQGQIRIEEVLFTPLPNARNRHKGQQLFAHPNWPGAWAPATVRS